MSPVTERPTRITFTVPVVALSKKNGQRITRDRDTGRRRVRSSEECEIIEEVIALFAARAVPRGMAQRGGSAFGANYVGVRIELDEHAEQMHIEVEDLGPQPAKGRRYTRRDIHNLTDSVMDALQGVLFDDDRQARFTVCHYQGWRPEGR
jgi:hypothetical protein